MPFKVKPQITVNPYRLMIWPIDQWSRSRVLEILVKHNIKYKTEDTSMAHPAFVFESHTDYAQVCSIISNYEA
jgi:hypothetical protein